MPAVAAQTNSMAKWEADEPLGIQLQSVQKAFWIEMIDFKSLLGIRDIIVRIRIDYWIQIQLRILLLSSVTLRMPNFFFHTFFLFVTYRTCRHIISALKI